MKVINKCPTSMKKKRNTKCSINIGESFNSRSMANIRERQRTQNLNNAFETLKKLIPTMATDKLSKIQTLKIAKCYIQFLNGLLNEEPIEKYQHENELKKGFKIWRMEKEANEQANYNNQVSSSSDFLSNLKSESDRDDYDKYSFDKDFNDKEMCDKKTNFKDLFDRDLSKDIVKENFVMYDVKYDNEDVYDKDIFNSKSNVDNEKICYNNLQYIDP